MSLESLRNELLQLDNHLVDAGVSRYWSSGISPEEIADRVHGVIDLPIPPEVIEWYGWHGGLDVEHVSDVQEKVGYVVTEFTPDGLIHPGLDQIIPLISAAMDAFECTYSGLWPGHQMFPVAIDLDGGIHWLQRADLADEWTLWQTGKEWEFQPHWNAFETRPADGPTLPVWVRALNEAFDRGDVVVTSEGVVTHRKLGDDDRYLNFPWPEAL